MSKRLHGLMAGTALRDDGSAAYRRGDYATALGLLRPLAEEGDRPAQLTLALMYYDGAGVAQDHAEAARWFRLAAEADPRDGFARGMLSNIEAAEKSKIPGYRGDAEAQYRLGMDYRFGWGVPKDAVSAYLWLDLATRQGHEPARSARDAVERAMTPQQIEAARHLVGEWKRPRSVSKQDKS